MRARGVSAIEPINDVRGVFYVFNLDIYALWPQLITQSSRDVSKITFFRTCEYHDFLGRQNRNEGHYDGQNADQRHADVIKIQELKAAPSHVNYS